MKASAPAFTALFIQKPFLLLGGMSPTVIAEPEEVGLVKVTPAGVDVPVSVSVTVIVESDPMAAGSRPISTSS